MSDNETTIAEKVRNCLMFIVMICMVLSMFATGVGWIQYLPYAGVPDLQFAQIQGRCSVARRSTYEERQCSGGNMQQTCETVNFVVYNVTVINPTGDLLAGSGAYISEGITSSSNSSEVDCWYALDPAAAAATPIPCGQPHCLKLDDPLVWIEFNDRGPAPLSYTAAAVVLLMLLCSCCFFPRICPGMAERIGIAAPDDSSSESEAPARAEA